MKRLALILLVALIGCEAEIPIDRSKLVSGPTGWETAALHACREWRNIGNRQQCPSVYWYGAESLDCLDGMGFTLPDGTCLASVQGGNGLLVGLPRSDMRPHETHLIHEFGHWYFGDSDHSDIDVWGRDPANETTPGSRVGDMNIALAGMGL